MPAWATFAGFAFVVTAALLLLSYASRDALSDDAEFVSGDDDRIHAFDDPDQTHPTDADQTRPTDADPPLDGADRTAAANDVERTAAVGDADPAATADDADGGAHSINGVATTHRVDEPSPAVSEDTPATASETLAATSKTPRRPPQLSTAALLANVAISQGLFGVLLLVGAWYAQIPARAFGVGPDAVGAGALALGVGVGVALYAANEGGAAVGARFGLGGGERLRRALAPETPVGWATLLFVVLPVIAGFEELLFRGALVGVLSAGFGVSPWLLAALSSAAFALGHGAQGRLGIAVTGALGFALAAVFVVTGSLLVVAVAHYLVNALEFLVHEGLGVEWPPEAG